MNNQKQLQYQSVINFVQQQFNNNKINVNKVQENVQILEKMINNEDEFFKWIDKQTEQDLILNKWKEILNENTKNWGGKF